MSPKKLKNYTIGLDIGGTAIKGILFDGQQAIADHELGTPKDDLDHFLVMLKAVVDPLLDKAAELKVKVSGLGIGAAGVMSLDKKFMLRSPNIPIIDNVNLAQEIGALYDLPIAIDNDANCFVLAEARLGAGQNRESCYGLVIGTGIGGAWYLKGEIHDGAHGGAGEPGEMLMDYASGLGLEEAYHRLTQNNPAQMAEEAYRGDSLAIKSYEELGRLIGSALANIANLINPEIFIIGGGAVESADLFLPLAKKILKENIESSEAGKKTKLAKAKLGSLSGAIGAALLITNSQSYPH